MTGPDSRPGGAVASSGLSVSEALAMRRSAREFLDRPVDRAVLEDILRRAARAPSGANLQPWQVKVIDGPDLAAFRHRMLARARAVPQGEPMPFPFHCADLPAAQARRKHDNGAALYAALGIARDDVAARSAWLLRNFEFFGAPAGIMLFLDAGATPFQWLDIGIYLQSVLLLLTEAGLDACPQADWAFYAQTVRDAFDMPPGTQVACGIAVGHADPDAPINGVRTRRDDPLP